MYDIFKRMVRFELKPKSTALKWTKKRTNRTLNIPLTDHLARCVLSSSIVLTLLFLLLLVIIIARNHNESERVNEMEC